MADDNWRPQPLAATAAPVLPDIVDSYGPAFAAWRLWRVWRTRYVLGGTMHSIDWAIQMLPEAESVEEIQLILKGSARAGVGAQGATVVRLEDGDCFYADEDAMSPLWKGHRFPVDRCISGWAMIHGQTVVIPDIRVDSRIPQEAYRPTFVRSLVMVPIRAESPVGAIGVYWADLHRASDEEVAILERLASAAGTALARVLDSPVHATAGAGPVAVA